MLLTGHDPCDGVSSSYGERPARVLAERVVVLLNPGKQREILMEHDDAIPRRSLVKPSDLVGC